MELKIKTASLGKLWAYVENGEEIILGSTLILGISDDGSRYYEVDDPDYVPTDNSDIIIDNATEDVVE